MAETGRYKKTYPDAALFWNLVQKKMLKEKAFKSPGPDMLLTYRRSKNTLYIPIPSMYGIYLHLVSFG